VNEIKRKLQTLLPPYQEDLHIDLTLHGVSADLLEQFALRVAQPYYGWKVVEAIKDLMQRAVADQEFVENHIEIQ